MKKINNDIITIIDVGTTKICTLIAEMQTDEENEIFFEIKGIGNSKTNGMKKGVVVEMDKATASIQESISEAEKMAKTTAVNIYIGIAGEHIRSTNIKSVIKLNSYPEHSTITQSDINSVIKNAKDQISNIAEYSQLEIIHALPQYFVCASNRGTSNPLDMKSDKLEAPVHIVMANPVIIDNILRCITIAGYKVNYSNVILEPIASAYAVLNEDQRTLGSMMIDIGGGTTDIAVFYRNSVRYTGVFPYGGQELSRRLSQILCTPLTNAEKIKLAHGQATVDNIEESDEILVDHIAGTGKKRFSKRALALHIQEEMNNLFVYIFDTVSEKIKISSLIAGIYLTGGASQLKYLDTLISRIRRMSTVIALPDLSRFKGQIATLEKPEFSTAVGIFLYLHENKFKKGIQSKDSIDKDDRFWRRLFKFVKSWFV